MGNASYAITAHNKRWVILHDGNAEGDYDTKEAAFEAAVGAASNALRQGHEVQITAPARTDRGTEVETSTTGIRPHG